MRGDEGSDCDGHQGANTMATVSTYQRTKQKIDESWSFMTANNQFFWKIGLMLWWVCAYPKVKQTMQDMTRITSTPRNTLYNNVLQIDNKTDIQIHESEPLTKGRKRFK
jgi:hypothetical protein